MYQFLQKMKLIFVALIMVFFSGCVSTSDRPVLVDMSRAAEANVALATAYLQRGRLGAANEKVLKALKQNPKSVEANSIYAALLTELGKHKEAEKYYKKAIRLDDENSSVRNNYGVFLCSQNRVEEGIEQFQKAILDPLYETPEFAYANSGACYLKVPDFEKAEESLRKALIRNKKMPLALYQMAKLNYLQSRYVLSKSYLDRFNGVANKSAESAWLGMRLAWHLGDEKDAANYALLLRNKFPDSIETQKLIQTQATRKR